MTGVTGSKAIDAGECSEWSASCAPTAGCRSAWGFGISTPAKRRR
jgi:hypothetical protein